MSWRSLNSGYLPIRAPPVQPPRNSTNSAYGNTSTSCLTSSTRYRGLLLLTISACSLFALFSVKSSKQSHPLEVFRGPSFGGVNEKLYELLEPIKLRQVILEPVTIPWRGPTTQQHPAPWSQLELLPQREANLAAYRRRKEEDPSFSPAMQDGEPIPRHRIPVYPRKIELDALDTYPRNEDLLFGITTTVERAKNMSELWTRWMLDADPVHPITGLPGQLPACMIMLSDREDAKDVKELEEVMKQRGLNCGVRMSSYERYEVRVMGMIMQLPQFAEDIRRTPKWFIFNDDDTFWLDMKALKRMLATYDPSEPWFVGATSEAHNQLEQFGRMAFGGAGMLLSSALITKMSNRWDECYEQFQHIFGGDEMITRCAALANGATKQTITTEEHGLHQFDVPGDTTGMLQSGIPFLNLHHYLGGSWVHLFGYGSYLDDFSQIRLIKQAAAFLGGDNMFRRFVFGDGRWLLVLGYSITIFEEKLTKEMLKEMEHTWYEGYRLSFEDRPAIPERRGDEGKPAKQTFYLDKVDVVSAESATFTFVQADTWWEHISSEDRVRIEVSWEGQAAGQQQQQGR